MLSIIGVNGKFVLPNYRDICEFIWMPNLSFSHVSYGNFRNISLDKWIENKAWGGHRNSADHIIIEQFSRKGINQVIENSICTDFYSKFNSFILISLNDDAVSVDIRALHRAMYLLTLKSNGSVIEKNTLLDADSFYRKYEKIIESEFSLDINN